MDKEMKFGFAEKHKFRNNEGALAKASIYGVCLYCNKKTIFGFVNADELRSCKIFGVKEFQLLIYKTIPFKVTLNSE